MSNRSTRKWLGFKLVVVTAAVMLVILGLAESDMVAAVFTVSLVVIIVMTVPELINEAIQAREIVWSDRIDNAVPV